MSGQKNNFNGSSLPMTIFENKTPLAIEYVHCELHIFRSNYFPTYNQFSIPNKTKSKVFSLERPF